MFEDRQLKQRRMETDTARLNENGVRLMPMLKPYVGWRLRQGARHAHFRPNHFTPRPQGKRRRPRFVQGVVDGKRCADYDPQK